MDLWTMVIRLTVTGLTFATVTDRTANVTVTVVVRIVTVPGQTYRAYVTETVTEVSVTARTVTVTVVTVAVAEAVVTVLKLCLEPNVPGRTRP
jgi:hypothetical protein